MICVVIGRTRHKMVQVEIQEAAKRGAQMLELRLDFLAKAPDFKRLLANKPCPMVATVRRSADGGRWSGTEDARVMLLRHAIISGFDWVDIEHDVADKIRRFKDVKRIISYHNMRETPDNLDDIYARMLELDPDVVKVAVQAQKPADNLRVLELLKNPPRPTVAFCMGDFGLPSRILLAKFGAPFTYAAFNKERGVAPGLPSFDEVRNVFHYDQIGAETKVFGVLGDPVAHSLSPLIHNAAMRAVKFNGVYLPFRVPRTELASSLRAFDRVPVRGYSVTIPNKEAAAVLALHKDPAVVHTKAANTLIRTKDSFAAYNTDYQAALESLVHHLPKGPDGSPGKIDKKMVLLLGAGGAARAVAHALHKHGALLTISNRTIERAQQLGSEMECRIMDWGARHSILCDVLINCTSVGMHPQVDETPIHPSFLRPGMVVFDTVYNPETTLLIKEARARGCHVITGVDMFVRQAALQFKLFTGQEPPLQLMYQLVRKALSPVHVKEDEPAAETEEAEAND